MYTEPQLETRAAVPYFGIRVQVPMSDFSTVIPQCHDKVFEWLAQNDIQPNGAPFMRFHVINMEGLMDIELGVPAESPSIGEGQITAGVIPAGRYATLIYTGVWNGMVATTALIEWANEQGLAWDRWDDPNGDAFASRVEFYLTDPTDEPDMGKWETEIAIKLAV